MEGKRALRIVIAVLLIAVTGCSMGTRDHWREDPETRAPEELQELEYPEDAEDFEGRLLPSQDSCPMFQTVDERTHLLTSIPGRYQPVEDFASDHFWVVCVENSFRNGFCGGDRSLRVVDMGLIFLKEAD